jgi:hypothetical protein
MTTGIDPYRMGALPIRAIRGGAGEPPSQAWARCRFEADAIASGASARMLGGVATETIASRRKQQRVIHSR